MNFLAHLWLAGNDEGLRLGAMLGDFTRGTPDSLDFAASVNRGILLHRFIDQYLDGLPEVASLREAFPAPFRRYSGIILDLAFDHELARRWEDYSEQPLSEFDQEVRALLERHAETLPQGLTRFMRYADRRGLFAAYRHETEILHSLRCVGFRLSRPNPLYRVGEIWPAMRPRFRQGFDDVFTQVERGVAGWLEQMEPRQHTA